MCFPHLLNLIAHCEAGLDYRIVALIKLTYKTLIELDDLHEVQKDIIKFLKNLANNSPLEIKPEFKQLLPNTQKPVKVLTKNTFFLHLTYSFFF